MIRAQINGVQIHGVQIIGPIIGPIIYPIIYPTIIWWVVRPWWAGQGANKKWRPRLGILLGISLALLLDLLLNPVYANPVYLCSSIVSPLYFFVPLTICTPKSLLERSHAN